jgi:hypothetical protein
MGGFSHAPSRLSMVGCGVNARADLQFGGVLLKNTPHALGSQQKASNPKTIIRYREIIRFKNDFALQSQREVPTSQPVCKPFVSSFPCHQFYGAEIIINNFFSQHWTSVQKTLYSSQFSPITQTGISAQLIIKQFKTGTNYNTSWTNSDHTDLLFVKYVVRQTALSICFINH